MNSRRSTRLAGKRRVNYNEENAPASENSRNEAEILVTELDEGVQNVQISEDTRETTITRSNNSENPTEASEMCEFPITGHKRVDRTQFREAAKTLSALKSTIASTRAAFESLEACLRARKSGVLDMTTGIDEISHVVNDDNDDCDPRDNSSKVEQRCDEFPEEQVDFEQIREIQSRPKSPDTLKPSDPSRVDGKSSKVKPRMPRFTLKLSDDLKEAYQPDLHISSPLEDTDVIIYDSYDPDFDEDDSIMAVVERKRDSVTKRKIRFTFPSSDDAKNTTASTLITSTNKSSENTMAPTSLLSPIESENTIILPPSTNEPENAIILPPSNEPENAIILPPSTNEPENAIILPPSTNEPENTIVLPPSTNKPKNTISLSPSANEPDTILLPPIGDSTNESENTKFQLPPICEIVPAKRSAPNSKDSGDILGPLLETLENQKKKFDVNYASSNEKLDIPYSSMSAEEHREFLRIDAVISQRPELVSKEQSDYYHVMRERFIDEMKRFEQWQFERSKLFLGHLNEVIQMKVMNHLKRNRHTSVNSFSIAELTIGLDPANTEGLELKFKQKLGLVGKQTEFSSPNSICVPLDRDIWLDDNNTAVKDYWQKKRTPIVSQDPLIPKMLSHHAADVVISSGGLAALAGLAESVDVELEMPISVVEVIKGSSTSKTIYIDKPSVKNQMTPRDINQVYYNTAFESMTLNIDEEIGNKSPRYSNNIEYSLWNMGDLAILIRGKSNAYFKESDGRICPVGIKAKLDYQMDYNYEAISNIERVRWWMYSTLRDKADIMFGRINVPENTICSIERVSLETILCNENWEKSLIRKIHYIFERLKGELPQGTFLFRHEKGERYATVYKGSPVDSWEIDSHQIKVDRETTPFIPLVWKGDKNQVINTFPLRPEPVPPRKKLCYNFSLHGKCNRKKCNYLHIVPSKLSAKGNNEDDLQYIADCVIASDVRTRDLDSVEESNSPSTPNFNTLLNNFNNKNNKIT